MMRAVITGGTGFVGQHLARHLAECGDEVLLIDRADVAGKNGFPLVDWDIRQLVDGLSCERIERFAPDAIYHLAAISVPSDCGSMGPSPLAFAVNVLGTANVLSLAESLKPAPRVLVVSSAYVYAPVRPQSPVVNENSPLGPPNAYGATKLAAENLARHAVKGGLPVVIARAFNHTGPGQADRMMLPEWCRKFAVGDNPVVVQCRNACLDLIDVRDVVRAYRLLIEHGKPGEAYNVGGGMARRSGDILNQLARIADPMRAIRELDAAARQQPIADISKLRAATGWAPAIDLNVTIAETYDYWQRVATSRPLVRSAA
jgi:GDP-4-dehydro-6-deoxy-D-mannose reductase